MDLLTPIVAKLQADQPMATLMPGGIWSGKAPAAEVVGADSEPAGEQPEDYMVISPISGLPSRTSSSNHAQVVIQLAAHCHDRGDGGDALAGATAAIERAKLLLLEADAELVLDAGWVVGVSLSSENYVPDGDLGWVGQVDFSIRLQRERVRA